MKAKDIIEKVEKRQLYKYIGQTQQGASEVLTQVCCVWCVCVCFTSCGLLYT